MTDFDVDAYIWNQLREARLAAKAKVKAEVEKEKETKNSVNIVYRLYTERKNLPELQALVTGFFDGYTLIWSTGVWRGLREQSVIIEIVADEQARDRVHNLAEVIRFTNAQTAVMVTEHTVTATMVTEVKD